MGSNAIDNNIFILLFYMKHNITRRIGAPATVTIQSPSLWTLPHVDCSTARTLLDSTTNCWRLNWRLLKTEC